MAASYVVFKRTAKSKLQFTIQNIVQACSRDYEYYFNFATHSYSLKGLLNLNCSSRFKTLSKHVLEIMSTTLTLLHTHILEKFPRMY